MNLDFMISVIQYSPKHDLFRNKDVILFAECGGLFCLAVSFHTQVKLQYYHSVNSPNAWMRR